MTFWLVRAGTHGEEEEGVLENNVVSIAWNELPDLKTTKTREDLGKLYTEIYGPQKKMHVANVAGQIWRFANEIKIGDLVALPLKRKSGIAIGEITGDYEFKEITSNIKHIRKVKWIKTFPRSSFDQDVLFSLGAFMTVAQIKRNDAENRVRNMLKGEITSIKLDEDIETETSAFDLEQYTKDKLIKFIARKFAGHDLSRLINEILIVKGYTTKLSPPGPDEGVDILAGYGPLGFSSPSICVQVKSSPTPVDVRIVRELEGVVKTFKADRGLLVAWGGINSKAEQEMSRSFFSIRLWDQDKIVEELIENYEKLDDSLKAEIPLKRIWTFVEEPDS
jgi:restriction system protein